MRRPHPGDRGSGHFCLSFDTHLSTRPCQSITSVHHAVSLWVVHIGRLCMAHTGWRRMAHTGRLCMAHTGWRRMAHTGRLQVAHCSPVNDMQCPLETPRRLFVSQQQVYPDANSFIRARSKLSFCPTRSPGGVVLSVGERTEGARFAHGALRADQGAEARWTRVQIMERWTRRTTETQRGSRRHRGDQCPDTCIERGPRSGRTTRHEQHGHCLRSDSLVHL
jgi:hypothetical protein